MLKDGRNFRSSYYEKVGFRSVEEKKSLELLLKNKTLDLNRLSQFCLRFTVPVMYRSLVWKLLLQILPFNKECHMFVTNMRKDQYNDLLNALIAIKYINDTTPKSQIILAMWLLENNNLKFAWNLEIELHSHLMLICQALCKIFCDEVDIYWISKGFFDFVKSLEKSLSPLVDFAKNLLFKSDSALHHHLSNIQSLDQVPYRKWFKSCFAGTLDENALIKIWDKLICGAHKILCLLSVALLRTFRQSLLLCDTFSEVSRCFSHISNETSDKIVNLALELWYQQGSYITPIGSILKV